MLLILGPKHRQRFLCEIRVDGFDYVGVGNSSNKKDAQANAAKDFVNFLVRQAVINPKEVPIDLGLPDVGSHIPGKYSTNMYVLIILNQI